MGPPAEPVIPWIPPAPLTPPVPPVNLSSSDDYCRTDVPECTSCCTGSCTGCRGYCESTHDGDCSSCWAPSPGAPPCNGRGTQCLSTDGMSCEKCWTPIWPKVGSKLVSYAGGNPDD